MNKIIVQKDVWENLMSYLPSDNNRFKLPEFIYTSNRIIKSCCIASILFSSQHFVLYLDKATGLTCIMLTYEKNPRLYKMIKEFYEYHRSGFNADNE